MGNINPNFFDRVRYELYNELEGSLIITEPEGWENDDKELSRHKEYHGIFPKFSNNLKFLSSGADYINFIDEVQGINAEIRLIRSERHPHTDVWTEIYSGYLDLSTKEKEDGKVSIKFNSGGLEQSLKSRESEQVEIDRTTTIDGLPLPGLVPKSLQLKGRRIFLKTSWVLKNPNDTATMFTESSNGNERISAVGSPFQLVNKSHENAHSVIVQSGETGTNGTTGMMFFAVSDSQRILNISLSMQFKIQVDQHDIDWAFLNISLTRYADNVDYNVVQRVNLFSFVDKHAIFNAHNRTFSLSYTGQMIVNPGDSLAIECLEHAKFQNGGGELRIKMTEMRGEMKMDEDSFFEPSDCKFVLAHELAERLVAISTNKSNVLYSEFLGRTDLGYQSNGPASLTGNTHGFWIRGFDKLPIPSEGPPIVENKFKPLTTSFKDFMSSYAAVWNLGLGIEQNFRSERIRMEPLSYFYNFNVTIKLPNQVSKEKRSCAADYFYSGIEIGYEEGGTYEEAMGLDEYNAKSNFTTIINRVKNTFTRLSKYRADSYGKEFARRKPESGFDSEDTSYDSSVFMMDLIKNSDGSFRERVWQDDFENAPTGIFSPETATNLRLSPFNMMLRHGWEIAGGLIKYPADYVRYGSSTANSALKTKLIGGNEYAENGNVINSELMRARLVPEWIEFEHECTFEVMQQVQGKSMVNGKSIQNFYGLVEFTNSNGRKEKGFLFNLKPNGNGQWKILKANR